METVAFYSYKGGVGRTLLVAHTAEFLAESGRSVVALDFDLEAPGLHYKFANPDTMARAARGELRGAVNELLDTLVNGPAKNSLKQTAIEVEVATAAGSLVLIPAGSAPSHAYWTALEQLSNHLSIHRSYGLVEAVLELQARIGDELAPDFLLVDSRTGITELGGLATSIMADRVVCLTTRAPESVDGTKVVADALRKTPRLSSQQPLRIEFLITRVPPESTESASVYRLKRELGGSVTVLPRDSRIEINEATSSPLRPYMGTPSLETGEAGKGLLSATRVWLAESFPQP
jgi:MinD-like ATPase involved in chromosome partitioning or flagellar assembly